MRRLVLTDLDRGTVHEFRDTDVRLGRDPRCELPIDAPASADVAGIHARISPKPNGWCLTDERTQSGTFVNHVRLVGHDVALLRSGDILRLGTGAGARKFRVVRVEVATQPSVRAFSPQSSRAVRSTAAGDVAVAGGALAGAAAVSAAAIGLTPRMSAANSTASAKPAPPSSPGAPPSATASPPIPVAEAAASAQRAEMEALRASRLFQAAASGPHTLPTAGAVGNSITALWTMVGGATAVSAAAVLYAHSVTGSWSPTSLFAPPAASAMVVGASRVPIPSSDPSPSAAEQQNDSPPQGPGAAAGTNAAAVALAASASPTTPAPDANNARLASAAASAGNLLGQVVAFYGTNRTYATGLVISKAGLLVSARTVVRNASGGTPDSVQVSFPNRTERYVATPVASADAGQLAMLRVADYDGPWLSADARGAVRVRSWVAVVGFDSQRLTAPPAVAATSTTAEPEADGLIMLEGVSARMLPGSPLVDDAGRVLGVLTAPGMAASIERLIERTQRLAQR